MGARALSSAALISWPARVVEPNRRPPADIVPPYRRVSRLRPIALSVCLCFVETHELFAPPSPTPPPSPRTPRALPLSVLAQKLILCGRPHALQSEQTLASSGSPRCGFMLYLVINRRKKTQWKDFFVDDVTCQFFYSPLCALCKHKVTFRRVLPQFRTKECGCVCAFMFMCFWTLEGDHVRPNRLLTTGSGFPPYRVAVCVYFLKYNFR